MKKIMIMIAAASLLVACGGNSEKKTEQKALTVEEQAVAYNEKYIAAVTEMERNLMEYEEWQQSLSEEDQMKAENAIYEFEKQRALTVEEQAVACYEKHIAAVAEMERIGMEYKEWLQSLSEEDLMKAMNVTNEFRSKYRTKYSYGEGYNYQKTEKKEEKAALSVEEQAKAYCEKLAAKDEAEREKIEKEADEWVHGLSKQDQAKAVKAVYEWEEAKEATVR